MPTHAGFVTGANGTIVNGDNVNFGNLPREQGELNAPGKIPIGTGVAFPGIQVQCNTLTAGAGIAIVNAPGSITISATGASVAINQVLVQAFTAPGTNPVLPVGNQITVNGSIVAAHAIPLRTDSLAANTFNVEAQFASQQGASSGLNAGMASFNNTQFSVDANGFVSEVNGLPATKFAVQASTAPGTNPVVPTAAGVVTVNGTIVAAHAIPIRTDSLAANTFNVEVQRAAATAATDATSQGMASFNSANFTVDANGFVTPIAGAGTIDITPSIGVHVTNSAYLFGASLVVASGNPIQTNGVAANQVNIQVQAASAQAASAGANAGLASFNSADFTVDANGFVSSISGAAPWLDSAGGALVNHTGYFATAAAVYTLPAGLANGDEIDIADFVGGGVVLTAQGGDLIRIGNISSSVNGTATTTQLGDSGRFVYRLAPKVWVSIGGVEGNWTLA